MQAYGTASISLPQYFETMIGPHGLYQHATGNIPLLSEGYCTDDNARAVQTLIHLYPHLQSEDKKRASEYMKTCWQFLVDAEESPGVYFNFRSAEGDWLPHDRSEDMYARLVRTYMTVITNDWDTIRKEQASALLPPLLQTMSNLHAPRAIAELLIALAEDKLATTGDKFKFPQLAETSITELLGLWKENSTVDWPWFEETMTYANSLLPHGLLKGLPASGTSEHRQALEQSTHFLIATTIRNNMFIPIGSNGWYPQGGVPSIDNQQPIEAGTMFDFLLDYHTQYQALPLDIVAAPYLWFFGKNTHQCVMVDSASGACYDGLFTKGPNMNCGAESFLAYIWAEVRLRSAPEDVKDHIARERDKLANKKPAV